MCSVALRVLQNHGVEAPVELPLAAPHSSCSVRLRCLPGADAVHLVLCNGDAVHLRAEVEAAGNEQLLVNLAAEEEGGLVVTSANRRVLILPRDDRYDPIPPITPAQAPESLDLALVIDGTAQHFYWEDLEDSRELRSRSLLKDQEQWSSVVATLQSLVDAAVEAWPDCRMALLAFGDQPVPQVSASDLRPSYLLYPIQERRRVLADRPVAEVIGDLQRLPASPGGDYVDALADALHACTRLRWRPEARKITLVVGDSPGHSVQLPAPAGGDGCVRNLDVDVEAMRLHRCGVELVTVFLEPALVSDMEVVPTHRRLLEFTREQYRRLASLPSLAFRLAGFDPEAAVLQLRKNQECIGRGAPYPELLEILPDGECGGGS